MNVYKCSKCGAEIIPKNDYAKMLLRQGRLTTCPDCRQRDLDYSTMKYESYLETDKWKQLAQECKESAGNRCVICNAPPPLDAHHRRYDRRGYEHPGDLTALCRRCHELVKGIVIY